MSKIDTSPAALMGWADRLIDEGDPGLSALGLTKLQEVLRAVAAEKEAQTYSSTQATNCAGCGKYKHTPLRIDAMDGYVCLTCIDQKLGSLLGEFGYAEEAQAVPQGWVLVPVEPSDAMVLAPGALRLDGHHARIHREIYRRMLAAAPKAPEAEQVPAIKAAEFESVKEAKRIAHHQLAFYREMLAKKQEGPKP